MPSPKITDLSKHEAIAWVARLRSESCSQEERRRFAEWLGENPEHPKLYAHFDGRWLALDRFKGADFPTRGEALRYRPTRQRRPGTWTGLAMAAATLLAVGLTAFTPDGWYGSNARYAAVRGQHETIALADGSLLELNSDTEVTVHLDHWRRSVELIRGEAFFSVVHQPKRPFVVTAANGRIVDIGTEFDVYRQADKVRVAVRQGIVRVEAGKSRELSANQALVYNHNGDFIDAAADNIENLTAWRQGQLVFDNRGLDEVLAELGRYHDREVRLVDPALAKLKVSGRFRIGQMDSALNIIASTLPISIQRPSAHVVMLKNR